MSGSWNEGKFVDYKAQLSLKQNCLSVWELIELVGMGYFTKGMDRHTTSMGITEVYQELILNILKQVRNGVCERDSLNIMFGLMFSKLYPTSFLKCTTYTP